MGNTRYRTKTNKPKTQYAKNINNMDTTEKAEVNHGAREGKAVSASYKTPWLRKDHFYIQICS
jgi:hypothetical protein